MLRSASKSYQSRKNQLSIARNNKNQNNIIAAAEETVPNDIQNSHATYKFAFNFLLLVTVSSEKLKKSIIQK